MGAIRDIAGRVIQNSRGEETLACTLTLDGGVTVESSVPNGKSTGSHEAVSVPAAVALQKLSQVVVPLLVGKDSADQRAVDDALCAAAGEQKQLLGANTTLAVSIAVARAHALETGVPLWKYLRSISGVEIFASRFPRPFVNLINGGAHTGNTKIFQEYMIIPQHNSMKESLTYVDDMRQKLGESIRQKYPEVALGDEGGFALPTEDPTEPLVFLQNITGGESAFAIDAAATESAYTDEDRTSLFTAMVSQFPLVYIEDPYGEEAFGLFARLQNALPRVVCVGDDLTTTNVDRMEQAFLNKSVTGVILKPNQIGTVTEALSAAAHARQYGWQVIASHRSGETEDTFIADFAYAVGADGIKIGASVQKERWAKYARLEAIESEINL